MKTISTFLVIAVLLLVISSCASQPSMPTITSEDNGCMYSGPDSIQADQFTFQWVMNGRQYAGNFIAAIQAEEGYSVDDLIGLDLKTTAPEVSALRYENRDDGGPWTKDLKWDLTGSARFKPGPIYFLCSHVKNGEQIIYGVAGPVEAKINQ